LAWAELFRRVFRTDVLRCERCGGRMKVLAFITERDRHPPAPRPPRPAQKVALRGGV
jgi:hypothetical protein